MSELRWPPSRRLTLAVSVIVIAVSALVIIAMPKRPETISRKTSTEKKEDPLLIALNRLERNNDSESCREVLGSIDAISNLPDPKPQPTAEQIQPLRSLLNLNDEKLERLSQPVFTQTDADYLADCFLLRDAVRSLDLSGHPPLRQAELAFAWVCRQVLLSNSPRPRLPPSPPAPPWWVLQAGSGSEVDRAYLFLAVLQQLGLDGCLIGPPELGNVPALGFGQKKDLRFAPVRAVGVRIKGDIFVFDLRQGKPVAADGKAVTLAQIRANPGMVQEWITSIPTKTDEAQRWEIFVAAPFPSFEPRMEWLERQMPAANAVRLFVDLPGLIDRFKKEATSGDGTQKTACRVWYVERDLFNLVNLQGTFEQDLTGNRGGVSHLVKAEYSNSHFPAEPIPTLYLDGAPLGGLPQQRIERMFRAEFANIFFTPNSARDNSLRGNFSNAISALLDLKDRSELTRNRVSQVVVTQADVDQWAREANVIYANLVRAERDRDPIAIQRAREAEQRFLASELTAKMGILVQQRTSVVLSAEAAYQLALVMHERAERAATRWRFEPDEKKRLEAKKLWEYALDSWQRYLNNFPQPWIQASYKFRFDHAERLQQRCQEGLAETMKK